MPSSSSSSSASASSTTSTASATSATSATTASTSTSSTSSISTSSPASTASSAPALPAAFVAVFAAVFLAAALVAVFAGAAAAAATAAVPLAAGPAFFATVFFAVAPLLTAGAAADFAAAVLPAAVLLAGAAFAVLAAAGLAALFVARAVVVDRVALAATARFAGALTCTSTPASSSARRTAFWRAAESLLLSNASRTSSPLRGRTEPADISCWMAGSENSEGSAAPERVGVVEPVDTDTDYLSRPRHATSTPIEVAHESMLGMEGSFLGTLGWGGRGVLVGPSPGLARPCSHHYKTLRGAVAPFVRGGACVIGPGQVWIGRSPVLLVLVVLGRVSRPRRWP